MTAKEQIASLLGELTAAWDAGDAARYGRCFAADADYIAFDGTHFEGRDAIVHAHDSLFRTFLKGSRLVMLEWTVRFPELNVAVIHSRGGVLRGRQTSPAKQSLSVQTLVAVQDVNGWTFVAFQNTRFRPFEKTLLGRLLAAFGPAQSRAAVNVNR